MGEENTQKASKFSRIKHHIVHHSQKVKHHIHRHHKKYLSGSIFYAVLHVAFIKVLAIKLFAFKIIISGLAFLGIYNHPMTDIFADMENLCINGKPMIAQEVCQKDFNTIQEAVAYIESEVNPETDTIYNASHYSLMTSILREYCGPNIDRNIMKKQRNLFRSINKLKDSTTKISYLKKIYDNGYAKSKEQTGTGEKAFCSTKYEAYNMLDMSKKAFLRELRKKGQLNPSVLSGAVSSSDSFLLFSFYKTSKEYKSSIDYTLPAYKDNKYNQELANLIKNISLKSVDDAISLLLDGGVLSEKDKSLIKNNMEVVLIPGCNKNTGYHKINQYLNDKNEITDVSLEEIKLNINLCKSYQYMDELPTNVSKLIIHEIGHYVYNFKDKTVSTFESICRNKQSNKCASDDFVTKYSQTNSEEDYAETFSRRALAELNNDKRYLSIHSNTVDTFTAIPKFNVVSSSESTHSSAPVDVVYQKFSYFDKLVSKK